MTDAPTIQPVVIKPGHVKGWRYDIAHAKARHEIFLRISAVEFSAVLDLVDEAMAARALAATGESTH